MQLINAATGYHVWSETYDRELDDVFAIQDEIAGAVASRLGPTLGLTRPVDYGGTRSFDAYDALLHGETEFAKSTVDGLFAAAASYRKALELDPGYARASAELAIALSQLVLCSSRNPRRSSPSESKRCGAR